MSKRNLINYTFSVFILAVIAFCAGCCNGEKEASGKGNSETTRRDEIVKDDSIKREQLVEIIDTLNLKIYFPKYTKIDLITEEMPSKSDSTVIFVAEAAFTAGKAEELAQGLIAGDHVSQGVRKKGYVCDRNNGAFVFYNDNPKFLYKDYSHELDKAAKNGGCGFAQEMMIHNGQKVPHTRPDNNINEFRALCLINGNLAIADSKEKVKFGDFINELHRAGATEALYLDMGEGWNYSWYRDDSGNCVNIHPESTIGTNWITFYK